MDFGKDKVKRQQLICSYGVVIINGMLALSIGSLLPFIRDARGLLLVVFVSRQHGAETNDSGA